jgi:hypothetical protein
MAEQRTASFMQRHGRNLAAVTRGRIVGQARAAREAALDLKGAGPESANLHLREGGSEREGRERLIIVTNRLAGPDISHWPARFCPAG